MSVRIVDDSAEQLRGVRNFLELSGHRGVLTASSAEEALRLEGVGHDGPGGRLTAAGPGRG
jgi:hypothetical protein